MSSRRSRLIRRAVRIALQGDSSALAACESMRATYKEVRRAARLSVKKLGITADQIKAAAATIAATAKAEEVVT